MDIPVPCNSTLVCAVDECGLCAERIVRMFMLSCFFSVFRLVQHYNLQSEQTNAFVVALVSAHRHHITPLAVVERSKNICFIRQRVRSAHCLYIMNVTISFTLTKSRLEDNIGENENYGITFSFVVCSLVVKNTYSCSIYFVIFPMRAHFLLVICGSHLRLHTG